MRVALVFKSGYGVEVELTEDEVAELQGYFDKGDVITEVQS